MNSWQVVDFDSVEAIPFFTDLQINGSKEIDILSAQSVEEIHRLGRELYSQGTIAYQPSLISSSEERTTKAIRLIECARRERGDEEAEILGIHLEGPFLAPEMSGAHPKEHLREPDRALISRYLAAGTITMITIAPELPVALEMIRFLSSMGVKVSTGHSNANRETVLAAFEAGATLVTHLYNRMSKDLVDVALDESDATIMLIADGSHVSDERIAEAFARAGNRIIAVTDAISTMSLDDQGIDVRDGAAFRSDGVKAGSISTMRDLWERIDRLVRADMATMACASGPATLMGRPELGQLEFGYPAQRPA